MAPARVDLHVHSTCSDGTATPQALAREAAGLGLDAIALTDHDTVDGVAPCMDEAARSGLVCVPAVELSTRTDGIDAHLLGYFIDPADPALLGKLERLRARREERVARMVRKLDEAGLHTSMGDVLAEAHGGAIGRAHLARVLVANGHAADMTDAFERLIGKGKPYWVRSKLPSAVEAIGMVRRAGGLPVLAHPALSHSEVLIPRLARRGLAGVEAYHAEHTPEQAAALAHQAGELGLLVTGGSDYHGPDGRTASMGSVELPPGAWEALQEAPRRA